MMLKNFQVIVIGGGHAGTEASMASARMGYSTLLLTQKKSTIGALSCNPSIGGIGKSHLVKEIDALGGMMASVADLSGIQLKILNTRKGVAVRSTRAQVDRVLYAKSIKKILNNQNNLTIIEHEVERLIIKNGIIKGVITKKDHQHFYSKSVIIATGTFLGGKIYEGTKIIQGGRKGDTSSEILAQQLKELPLNIKRLKTGTPPRLYKPSINYEKLQPQYGDFPLPFFSFIKKKIYRPQQIPCFLTYTNEKTHEIIQNNITKSAVFNGNIIGIGPRYCPSIEDKVMRFPDKNRHQIFLEPEGLNSFLVYPNGISTSFPISIQKKIIQSINGLHQAQIIQPGYAVEYDFLNPKDLKLTLESKYISGLFFAGQVNGTTGYEEAASQGLLAGINAALNVESKEPWFPRRDQAYLGVMIDDLCTHGTTEPYRIFTSRAEYRLSLRENNADIRLTHIGKKLNLINEIRWNRYIEKTKNIQFQTHVLKKTILKKTDFKMLKTKNITLSKCTSYLDLLKRPNFTYLNIEPLALFKQKKIDLEALEEVETMVKYHGYILRQQKEIQKKIYSEHFKLPNHFNYQNIKGLSNEVINKLNKTQPYSLGQASRIEGITPAAISILIIYFKKIFLQKENIY